MLRVLLAYYVCRKHFEIRDPIIIVLLVQFERNIYNRRYINCKIYLVQIYILLGPENYLGN